MRRRAVEIAALSLFLCCCRTGTQMNNAESISGLAAVNGTRLYYEIQGEGHPLVLIHGGLVDRRMWDDQFAVFAKKYRVVRYDIRGYEKSEKATGPFSHVEDLFQLMKVLQIQKAFVIGLSLGGQIAIDFALEHPDMVDALIPVASSVTGFPFKISADLRAGYEAVLKAAEEKGLDEAVDALLQLPFFIPYRPSEDILKRMRPMLKENFSAWTSAATKGMYLWPEPPAFQRIENISVPTLIIVGDMDSSAILDAAEDLAKRIKGARKVVIPGAAHHVNMEKPDEFSRVVLEFLGRL